MKSGRKYKDIQYLSKNKKKLINIRRPKERENKQKEQKKIERKRGNRK